MSEPSSKIPKDDPFYIKAGCCMWCGVPEEIAPELVGSGKDQCMMRRQPSTRDEIDKMVEIMWSAEVDCFRYAGDDIAFLKRLGQAGMGHLADSARAEKYSVWDRDRVEFSLPREMAEPTGPATLAQAFQSHLRRSARYTFRGTSDPCRVSFSWYENLFYEVDFMHAPGGKKLMAVIQASVPGPLPGLSLLVHKWLSGECGAADIAWHDEASILAGDEGFRMPY